MIYVSISIIGFHFDNFRILDLDPNNVIIQYSYVQLNKIFGKLK